MSYNSPSDLAEIIFIPEGVDGQTFLDMANLVVTEDLASSGLSEARLTLIELWLAAHYLALAEEKGGLTRTVMGETEDWFSDVYTAGLNSTRFGQTAVSFDTSGTLAKSASGKGRAVISTVRSNYD